MKEELNTKTWYTPATEITVTKQNVSDLIHSFYIALINEYGPRVENYLIGIAIGPNAYKCLEVWGQENCTFSARRHFGDDFEKDGGIKVAGVRIFAGSLPFPMALWNSRGWHFAQREAVKLHEWLGEHDA